MEIQILQEKIPVVCDGYVKYQEAEVDRLVAILKQINPAEARAGAADRVEYSNQHRMQLRWCLCL